MLVSNAGSIPSFKSQSILPFQYFRSTAKKNSFVRKSYQVILLLNVKRLLQLRGTEPNLSKRKVKKKGQMHVGFSFKSMLAAWLSWKTHCNKWSPNIEDILLINPFSTTSFTARRVLQKTWQLIPLLSSTGHQQFISCKI